MSSINIFYNELDGSNHLTWPGSADELIKFSMNPSFAEMNARRAIVEPSMLGSLIDFLKSHGLSISVPKSDIVFRNRMDIWSLKLKEGCIEYSDIEILHFLESLGIDLRDIQEQGILKGIRNYLTIFSPICGSGKTLIILILVLFLKSKKGVKAIFLAPNSATDVYMKEIIKFRKHLDLSLENLTNKSKDEINFRLEESNADILVLPSSIIHRHTQEIRDFAMRHKNVDTVFFNDEVHMIKNVLSRLSRAVQSVAPYFDWVKLSTATPMPLGPKDVRGYLSTVSTPMPERFYRSDIPTEDRILFQGIAFVSGEEDLEYGPVEKYKFTYDDQTDLDIKLIEEIQKEVKENRKAIVFCSTNNAMSHVYNSLKGIGRVVLSGSYSTSNYDSEELLSGRDPNLQQKAIDQFNNDDGCKVMIANYKVGSTGLNLQGSGARLAFYYEITNNGADFLQSKYRIRRPYIFPDGGFRYVYAIPSDIRKRRSVSRQFQKLEEQKALLDELRSLNGGVNE